LGAALLKVSGSGGEIVAGLVDALMFFAHSATSRPATSSPATPTPANAPHTATLVAYQGRQVPGYRVAYAPRGWVIQGGNVFALVIAAENDKDKSIDSFAGKLVVMLQSRDQHGAPAGVSLPVNGRPGRFSTQGETQILFCKLPGGRWADIQAPTALGWNSRQLARSASGVWVLGNVQEGGG
jgi:hypothetical protein